MIEAVRQNDIEKGESKDHSPQLADELRMIREDTEREESIDPRSRVLEGLSEVKSERLGPDSDFRFIITAAVQSDPYQLGEWLDGDGGGFEATDRPVNTSLIDRNHNWTFEGRNGFILNPPEDSADIIAASPHDIGSSDLQPQPIELTSDELLRQTSLEGYNQVNIRSGSLAGVFIKLREDGSELGNSVGNEQLRAFAISHGKPVVEIVTQPQELKAGEPTLDKIPAKGGNDLWKVRFPQGGVVSEVDIIRFQPGEQPIGFTIDSSGFDMRARDINGYGETSDPTTTREGLQSLMDQIAKLETPPNQLDADALAFAKQRLLRQLQGLDTIKP